jgi:hypothetical protein
MAFGVVVLANGARADDLMATSLVEVHERVWQPTTYYLRYPVQISDGDLAPLLDARLAPGADLAVFQRSEGFNDCLVKGQVFSQQIHLTHGVDGSTVEVIGADTLLRMDRETKITQWADNTSDSDAVSQIVGAYSLTPDVTDTATRHLQDKRTLIQHDTDLNFVRMLARRSGCLFWVRCDADLVETAYFQPPPLDASDAPLLALNLDNPTLDTFDIVWDAEQPTTVIAQSWDGAAKQPLDVAGVEAPTGFPDDIPFSEIVTEPRSASLIAAVSDAGDLTARARGLLTDASWFITATCTVSAARLGRVIRSHSVVRVDGVGSRYSGLYFVTAVRHVIDETDHRMEVTLARNGWSAGGVGGGLLAGLL